MLVNRNNKKNSNDSWLIHAFLGLYVQKSVTTVYFSGIVDEDI